MATEADVLEGAANRLSREGAWSRGAIFGPGLTSMTTEGALHLAGPRDIGDASTFKAAAALLELELPASGVWERLRQWNDAPEQTQAAVVEALRAAAARVRLA